MTLGWKVRTREEWAVLFEPNPLWPGGVVESQKPRYMMAWLLGDALGYGHVCTNAKFGFGVF